MNHLSKFYSLYDPETSLFDGKFKLTGSLCEFKDDNDIHSLFEKISQYVLERFKDLDCPPLSLYKIFDFRNWPHTLADLSTYGCKEIKLLCEHCNDLLTEEEVNSIPNEWQTLKVQVSMQRTYLYIYTAEEGRFCQTHQCLAATFAHNLPLHCSL